MLTNTLESIRARLPSSHMQNPSIPTMKQRISRVSVVVIAVLISFGLASVIAGPSAYAQSPSPGSAVEVGLAAGAAFPQANRLGNVDVAGGTNTGFTVAGSVQARLLDLPLRFRLEAQYTRLGLSDERRVQVGGAAPVVADGTASMLNGTGNFILAAPTGSRLRPYLIGGLGIYRLSSTINITTSDGRAVANGAPSESETRFGLNGGAGLELPTGSMRTFVEARFHGVLTEDDRANFIPVVIGVRF
ncbi:hypothetical protein CRI93_00055 [Longimonas halophila]|uniref:Outer membrane protein beta-barrel domain-containing protein n=1 Tax=Longimonas halophila TaxID=1469170 RepID=A0A2H3NPI9_9BACT|nr:outer membrane beta-barrel protein [Longimonas halophila]PEN09163.1 hypothetical protein CRI93_00055 [Longimonas halophila]